MTIVCFGRFVLDRDTRELRDAGRRVALSPKACQLLVSLVVACSSVAVWPGELRAQPQASTQPPQITIRHLGTAPGPPVRVGWAGISTLIEAGGQRFLFDAGYGSLARLVESGLPMDGVTKVFLTHLHSDHVADLPAFLLLPWSAPSERDVPLEIWGPAGTTEMMRHLQETFAFDIHVRRDLDEKVSAKGIEVIARDIQEGVIYNQNGVKITAFLVDHGAVKPAFGYRVDYAGRSVALSGDTRPNDNLVAVSKGVDVLIHEAIDEVSLRKLVPSERLFRAIVAHHTTPEQAADIFRRVGPRLAVFSHAQGGPAVVDRTRRSYPGRVEMGEDLMVIEIGEEVVVRRHESVPRR
jgi:ribonuclease Z